MGIDINPSNLSKSEGQTRSATDIELKAIVTILGVGTEALLMEHTDQQHRQSVGYDIGIRHLTRQVNK